MGRRVSRVILVLALLVTTLAGVYVPGAAAEDSEWKTRDVGELQLDGFFSSGRVHQPDLSQELVRGVDESRAPQVVVGPDSRTQVADTTLFPYSAVAHLELYEQNESGELEGVAICSSSFVGPNVLLTAAHCAWDGTEWDGFIDRIIVVPGANGDVEPFGFAEATNVWIPDAYTTNSDPGSPFDYALITIGSTDIEAQTGSFEIGILTTSELQDPGFNPTTSGYPGDKPFGTQWISSEAAFDSVDDVGMIHSIDSFQGQSGSPVWRGSDMAVVGVESAENDTQNLAIRLDLAKMYEFMAACQEMGCKINHFLTDIPGDGGAYDRVWERTDLPVASGAQARTWMWGPEPISKVMLEPYAEAPNGFRTVLYQEKSRMEITTPDADPNSIWYVTNGLATVELMTGNLQLGNNTFEQYPPAEINVAGDGDDPNGPTYVTFAGLVDAPPHGPSLSSGSNLTGGDTVITATVDRAGNVGDDPSLASEGVTAQHWVPETGHYVASVFWEFMNSSGTVWENGQYINAPLFDNAFFATGFPVTEAYWATVRIGGTERTVLVQAFERRVLTYAPGNPDGFQVEAGNVGSHFKAWLDEVTFPDSSDPGTEPPPPPPDNPPPALGELLFGTDLSNTPEIETESGAVGTPQESSYQVTTPPGGGLGVTTQDTFGDAYYSIDVRMTQSTGAALACLIFREVIDPEQGVILGSYWLCVTYEGPLVAGIEFAYVTSQSLVPLAAWSAPADLPASEWFRIGVVAEGQEFWVTVDDVPIGNLVHDAGPGVGSLGFLVGNLEESGGNAVFELTELVAFSLVSGETSAQRALAPSGFERIR